MSPANPETSAALSLLSAKAVRERAHRMLAIGLEGRLPNFRIDLDRMDGAVDLVLETTRSAYPSLDVPFHSRWRHFVTNGDDRWADCRRPDRLARSRRPAPGPNSISPSSASSSMPAPVHRGATAIPKPDRPSAVRKDWDWPALPCSRAAPSRPIRSRALARRCRRARRILASPTSNAACRSRMSIRWSGWTAVPTCCVAWAGWWPRNRKYSRSRDTPRPGGLYDRLAKLADEWQACQRQRS